MENFFDYMIFCFFTFAIIGALLGGWVFFGEKIIKKFNLESKIENFFAYED